MRVSQAPNRKIVFFGDFCAHSGETALRAHRPGPSTLLFVLQALSCHQKQFGFVPEPAARPR